MKKMKKQWISIGVLLMMVCSIALAMAGCGEKITVQVSDMGTVSEVETSSGKSVSDILKDAEIELGEKDEVTPSADTTITEADTTITVARYAKVTIVNGDDRKEVELVGGTVADAIKEAKITLGKNDAPNVAEDKYLTDGMEITIIHTLNITLKVDGETKQVKTTAETVSDLLKEQKIELGKDDSVSPKKSSTLKDGDTVTVGRVTYKEETVTETIPFGTETQYSESMDSGTSTVTQDGVNGSKEVVYKVKYVDGKEDSREAVSETVTKNAVSQIVVYGTRQQAAPQAPANQGGSGGRTIVSKQRNDDCDGSGHGYFTITYSDGTVEYEEY